MIRIIRVGDIAAAAARLQRPADMPDRRALDAIIRDIQKNGDAAVRKYEKKFGGTRPASLRLSDAEIADAISRISKEQMNAIRLAESRLAATEKAVMSGLRDTNVRFDGVHITKRFAPLQSVGCYVPGGLARYPSSAIMSVTTARIAGVRRIAVATPPDKDGMMDPLTVAAASICGATEIYRMGGVQAIAALAFGTQTIQRVDKLAGPGGRLVTTAKHLVSGMVPIDMLAGPTELGIIADDTADSQHVALDLISQSEHSPDTRCFLITDSIRLAKQVRTDLARISRTVSRRDIVRQSLKGNGFAAVCDSVSGMADLAQQLAPEHLQIMTKNPSAISRTITSAGLVLLGRNSPSAASDYVLGSNHILPTDGFGRARGPLSVLDFVKLVTQVRATKAGLAGISGHMQELTHAEGLDNHYEAVRGRLQ